MLVVLKLEGNRWQAKEHEAYDPKIIPKSDVDAGSVEGSLVLFEFWKKLII